MNNTACCKQWLWCQYGMPRPESSFSIWYNVKWLTGPLYCRWEKSLRSSSLLTPKGIKPWPLSDPGGLHFAWIMSRAGDLSHLCRIQSKLTWKYRSQKTRQAWMPCRCWSLAICHRHSYSVYHIWNSEQMLHNKVIPKTRQEIQRTNTPC